MLKQRVLYHVSLKNFSIGEVFSGGDWEIVYCNLFPHIHKTIVNPSVDEEGTVLRDWYSEGNVYEVEPLCSPSDISINLYEQEIQLPKVRIVANLGSVADNLKGYPRSNPTHFSHWLRVSYGIVPDFGSDAYWLLEDMKDARGTRRRFLKKQFLSLIKASSELAALRTFEKFSD